MEKIDKYDSILWELRGLEENSKCADCTDSYPRFMNITHGTFVCSVCGAIHREIGDRVKAIGSDKFSKEDIEKLKSIGNKLATEIWLSNWDSKKYPLPLPSEESKVRDFIKMKYQEKKWYNGQADKNVVVEKISTPSVVSPRSSSTSSNANVMKNSGERKSNLDSKSSLSSEFENLSLGSIGGGGSSGSPSKISSTYETTSATTMSSSSSGAPYNPFTAENRYFNEKLSNQPNNTDRFPPFSDKPFDQHSYLNEKVNTNSGFYSKIRLESPKSKPPPTSIYDNKPKEQSSIQQQLPFKVTSPPSTANYNINLMDMNNMNNMNNINNMNMNNSMNGMNNPFIENSQMGFNQQHQQFNPQYSNNLYEMNNQMMNNNANPMMTQTNPMLALPAPSPQNTTTTTTTFQTSNIIPFGNNQDMLNNNQPFGNTNNNMINNNSNNNTNMMMNGNAGNMSANALIIQGNPFTNQLEVSYVGGNPIQQSQQQQQSGGPIFPQHNSNFESGNSFDFTDHDEREAWREIEEKKEQVDKDHELAIKLQKEEETTYKKELQNQQNRSRSYTDPSDYYGSRGSTSRPSRNNSRSGNYSSQNNTSRNRSYSYDYEDPFAISPQPPQRKMPTEYDTYDGYVQKKRLPESYSSQNLRKPQTVSPYTDNYDSYQSPPTHNSRNSSRGRELVLHEQLADCDYCGKKVGFEMLNNHKNSECLFRQVRCNYCNKLVKHLQLNEHEQLCKTKTYTCGVCGKFVLGSEIPNHMSYVHKQ
ncbi:Arf GTPase activating protein [Tieghemostelium lacteum]|uniref:Arf GTPase activating protein n=1 Tax=Tieghemostelium lacteum TaxID=361077 RepID=A0A151Z356_TIELA|nr:Arf GTPase activating protein [Tieghemostelium lacteum]|eukprot:KYQ88381.1 Arf GTPase activating protein [Tieghemostelium lacteum]